MPLPTLVVFDMAGTTIQASDPVPAAFYQAFEQIGVDLPADVIKSVRGKSKREAISDLLTRHLGDKLGPPRIDSVYANFQEILTTTFEREGVQPVPGASETFAWLHERGVKVALTTGFDTDLAERLVRGVDWEDAIDALVCNSDVPRGRPAPDLIFTAMARTGVESVQNVAVVGDTISDLQAARNAGAAWSIGVLSGAHSAEQLRGCPHTAIIDSVKNLPALFERIVVSGPIRSVSDLH